MSKPWQDPETLHELYHTQGLTMEEVASELGCSKTTVHNWLQNHGIATRKGGRKKEGEWDDEDVLKELYHGKGMSLREVADELGCSDRLIRNRMEDYGIETRTRLETLRVPYATFYSDAQGYECWSTYSDGSKLALRAHRLLAIAEGQNPHDIFSGDTHVHHKNGIKWDNRPENIVAMDASEHLSTHTKERHNQNDLQPETYNRDQGNLGFVDKLAIKEMYRTADTTQKVLAEEFGVSQAYISRVIRGEWA